MSKKLKLCPFCGKKPSEFAEECEAYCNNRYCPIYLHEMPQSKWETRTADTEIDDKDWPTELWELFVEIDDIPKAMVVNDLRNYILGIQTEIVELKRRGKK